MSQSKNPDCNGPGPLTAGDAGMHFFLQESLRRALPGFGGEEGTLKVTV